MRKLLLALCTFPLVAWAQIGNYPALIGQKGTTTPSTCTVGQLFFDTDATAGSNIYGCTSANTWTLQGLSSNIPLSALAAQAANTIVANATGSSASPTAIAVPSCSAATSALTWTSNTGFGCNTITSGATLNAITAATGAATIASGNNTGIVWNWANTSNSTTAFTYGETTAATNGTSSSGIPNQVLLKLTTLASSTQSPLSVYSRGTHTFSVSPTSAQILAGSSGSGAPVYSFAASPATGIFGDTSGIYFGLSGLGGAQLKMVDRTGVSIQFQAGVGSAAHSSITDNVSANTGVYWPSTNVIGISNVTDGEWVRWLTRAMQFSGAKDDAVSYAINARKSRGTVASPTVITTGDDLMTMTGYGYVGGSNTYQDAARIKFDSAGTISDATNGIGGIISFSTKKQGANTTVIERAKIDQAGHLVSVAGVGNAPSVASACGTTPAIIGTDNAFRVTIGTGGVDTTCVVNFGTAYTTNAPVCMAQSDTDIVALKSSATTSAITITASAAFTAGSLLKVLCTGIE